MSSGKPPPPVRTSRGLASRLSTNIQVPSPDIPLERLPHRSRRLLEMFCRVGVRPRNLSFLPHLLLPPVPGSVAQAPASTPLVVRPPAASWLVLWALSPKYTGR